VNQENLCIKLVIKFCVHNVIPKFIAIPFMISNVKHCECNLCVMSSCFTSILYVLKDKESVISSYF